MTLATESTLRKLSLAVARTAAAVHPLAGCGDAVCIDRVGSVTLARALDQFHIRCTTRLCEGIKDEAPWVPEGSVYGARPTVGQLGQAADLLTDPVEGTNQLAGPAAARSRASYCIAALAPAGSVADLYSGSYALKLVLPPHAPADLDLGTPPAEIVRSLADEFGRAAADVHVWILDRPRNHAAIAAFADAGATVRRIAAGDFESHLRAGQYVRDAGPIHVSYGIGGLPEGVLAVPFLRWSGGRIRLKPHPLGAQEAEIRAAGLGDMLGRVFDAGSLIKSDDCVLAVAGITSVEGEEPPLVKGVRYWENGAVPSVTVLAVSPALPECRTLEIAFEDYQPTQRPVPATVLDYAL